MILCNHFAITTTCLQGHLLIYCKKAFFTEKSTPTQIAENPQLVEQKPCQSAFSPTFRVRYIQRKKSQKTLRLSFLERKTRVCPSALSISLFSKNRSDAAGGCSQSFCFFFEYLFSLKQRKKVLVYVLLSYTIFLYSLYISANRCTSNLLKITHTLLISANIKIFHPQPFQTFSQNTLYS